MNQTKQGFTLIELVLVMGIVASLSVVWGGNHFCTTRELREDAAKSTTARLDGDSVILHCGEKNDLKMIFLH